MAARAASVAACAAVLGCGETGQTGGPDGGGAAGSVRRLVEVDDAVVATGLGPALVVANGKLIVGYGSIEGKPPAPVQRVAIVSTDLTVEHDLAVYSALPGATEPTLSADIRLARCSTTARSTSATSSAPVRR